VQRFLQQLVFVGEGSEANQPEPYHHCSNALGLTRRVRVLFNLSKHTNPEFLFRNSETLPDQRSR